MIGFMIKYFNSARNEFEGNPHRTNHRKRY